MAKKRERVAALAAALLFLFTSVGATAFVLWQVYQEHKASTATTPTNPPKEAKLEGTKLSNFTPVDSITSLQTIDTQVGTGDEVKPGDMVTVHYTGAVAKTGIIFQSSLDSGQPVSFSLSGVIKGWTDGIPGMKVGGTRRLLIPAAEAYGANPPPGSNIPPNADLVFDVQLLKIGQ